MRQLQIAKRAALIRMHGARYARRQDEGRLRFVAVRLAECSDSEFDEMDSEHQLLFFRLARLACDGIDDWRNAN